MASLLDRTSSDDECWSDSSLSSTYISESDTDYSAQSAHSTSNQARSSRRHKFSTSSKKNKNKHKFSNAPFAMSTSLYTSKKNDPRVPSFDQMELGNSSEPMRLDDLTKIKEQNWFNIHSNTTKVTPKQSQKSSNNLRTSPQSEKSQQRNFWNEVDATIPAYDSLQKYQNNCTNDVFQGCQLKTNSTTSSFEFVANKQFDHFKSTQLPEPTIPIPTLAQLSRLSRPNNYPSDCSVDSKESLAYSVGTYMSKLSGSDTNTHERLQGHQIDLILKMMSTLANENKIEDPDMLDVDDVNNDNEYPNHLPRQGLWSADEEIYEPGINLALNSNSFVDIIQESTPHKELELAAESKDKVNVQNSFQNKQKQQNDYTLSNTESTDVSGNNSSETGDSFANNTKGKKRVSFFENVEYDTPDKMLHWDQIYHHNAARKIQKCYKKWHVHHLKIKIQLEATSLSQKNAITTIQALVRGRSCRHAILCRMGIAKRQKWEKRTKSAELTLLHSKIRRSARAFLREKHTLQTSMIFAIRRVCAITVQKWWRKYMPRKMGPTASIKRFCAIRIQRWVRSPQYNKKLMLIVNMREINDKKQKAAIKIQAVVRKYFKGTPSEGPITESNTEVLPSAVSFDSIGARTNRLHSEAAEILNSIMTQTETIPEPETLPELKSSQWDNFHVRDETPNETENMSISLLSAFNEQKKSIAKKFKRLRRKKKKKEPSKSFVNTTKKQRHNSKSFKHKSPFAIARRFVSGKRFNNGDSLEKILNDNKETVADEMDDPSVSSIDEETDDDVNVVESRQGSCSTDPKKKHNYEISQKDADSISSQSQDDLIILKDEEISFQSYIELDDDDDDYGGFNDEDKDVTYPPLSMKETQSGSTQLDFVFDPFNILTGIEIVADDAKVKLQMEYETGDKLDNIVQDEKMIEKENISMNSAINLSMVNEKPFEPNTSIPEKHVQERQTGDSCDGSEINQVKVEKNLQTSQVTNDLPSAKPSEYTKSQVPPIPGNTFCLAYDKRILSSMNAEKNLVNSSTPRAAVEAIASQLLKDEFCANKKESDLSTPAAEIIVSKLMKKEVMNMVKNPVGCGSGMTSLNPTSEVLMSTGKEIPPVSADINQSKHQGNFFQSEIHAPKNSNMVSYKVEQHNLSTSASGAIGKSLLKQTSRATRERWRNQNELSASTSSTFASEVKTKQVQSSYSKNKNENDFARFDNERLTVDWKGHDPEAIRTKIDSLFAASSDDSFYSSNLTNFASFLSDKEKKEIFD